MTQLSEAIFSMNEPVDLAVDIEVIRFFLCYALSKARELHKGAARLFVLIPANSYNIGTESLDEYWMDFVVDNRNTTGSAIERVKDRMLGNFKNSAQHCHTCPYL
uniref:Leucyl-tRNA synthetase n=1 Tax=Ditylenchus dipsaci TaxID=166011 RepID=A0A915DUY2_9BILA